VAFIFGFLLPPQQQQQQRSDWGKSPPSRINASLYRRPNCHSKESRPQPAKINPFFVIKHGLV
jgi:hypothetical protein